MTDVEDNETQVGVDITQIIEPIRATLAPVGNSLSDAWSAILGDRIASWRLANAAKLQVSVVEKVRKLGLTIDRSRIPERYAYAWFDEATKQDEPEIQELFARLLARAATGDEDAIDRRHLEILGKFTPMDALVMEWLFEHGTTTSSGYTTMNEFVAWQRMKTELSQGANMSMEHLIALGVFERQYGLSQDSSRTWAIVEPGMSVDSIISGVHGSLTIESDISSTERGVSLRRACAPISTA